MRCPNRNGYCLCTAAIALAVVLAPAAASGQARGPVRSGSVKPVLQPAAATPSTAARRQIPLLTPVGEAAFQALKARAASSRAPGADQQLSPSIRPNSADITTSFVGLNISTAANHGFSFVPPDPQVAKSPTKVLELTNSAARLFTTSGGVVQTADLNTFFGASTTDGILFDPKIVYDRNATNRRFYAVALQQSGGPPQVSFIWLAVSRSADPANLDFASWCHYNIPGIYNGGTTNASWADYPGLGTAADALLISHNQFRFSDNTFTFALVHAFRKLVAANNASSCPTVPFFLFQPSGTIGDGTTFTLQPVQQISNPSSFSGTTNPSYLINTIFGTSSTYRVTRIRNLGTSTPTFQQVDVAGNFTYSIPPGAVQSGSGLLLDTGDNRATEAAGKGNNLWGAHATGCSIGGSNVACGRAVRLIAGQSGTGAPTATISQQRTIGQASSYFFWPGIAVNLDETTLLDFHYVSPSATNGRLSSWWTIKDLGNTFYGSISPLTTGTCAQTTNRTGDYTGADVDGSDGKSFWLASERATAVSGFGCSWQTQIAKVVPGNIIVESAPVADR